MIRIYFTLVALIYCICSTTSNATTIITVGSAGADYATIKTAYNSCVNATDYVIRIQADYNYDAETNAGVNNIVLTQLANKSAQNTVTIMPDTGVNLSFIGTATSIFYLNGADWVIFEGRANGQGPSAWTIANSSALSSKRVFTFINDATNNILNYLTIKGDNASTTNTSAGLVHFSTTSGSTGNDNNTIDNCIIRENSVNPGCLINSYGTSTKFNSTNSITNCQLLNGANYDIWVSLNSDDFTISNNSFFQSQSQTLTSNSYQIYIYKGASYSITNNYFGGQAPLCSGTAFTLTSSNYTYIGISINDVDAGIVEITGNHFQNIAITSTIINEGGFSAIYIASNVSSICTIGSLDQPNHIGTALGNTSISLTNDSNTNSVFRLIYFGGSGEGCKIQYNNFGDINLSGNALYVMLHCIFINATSANSLAISNNNIGNTHLANITSTMPVKFYGIYVSTATTVLVSNNIVQNINLTNTGKDTYFSGIYCALGGNTSKFSAIYNTIGSDVPNNIVFAGENQISGIYMSNTLSTISEITNNVIQNFAITGTGSSNLFCGIRTNSITNAMIKSNTIQKIQTAGISKSTYSPIIIGITAGSSQPGIEISGNNIINLSATSTTAFSNSLIGIQTLGSGHSIYENFISGLSNASLGVGPIYNFKIEADDDLIYNNVIICNGGGNTHANTICGLYLNGNISANVYHNTIKLFGSVKTGSNPSYAFYSALSNASYTQNILNNIFQNLRTSDGATAQHFAEGYSSVLGQKNTNYNYLENHPSQSTNIGRWVGAQKSFLEFVTVTGAVNDVIGTITIDNATGKMPFPSTTDVKTTGTNSSFPLVSTDYNGLARSNTGSGAPDGPWMGAFEKEGPNPGTDGNMTICSNGLAENLFSHLGGNPSNDGTWSGPSDLTSGDLGTFDPSINGAGTYTYSNGGATATVHVNVNNAPQVTANTGSTTICIGSSSTLVNTIPNGAWTSSDAMIATVSADGNVDGLAVGTLDILYTVTENGCSATATSPITIVALPKVTLANLPTFCVDVLDVILSQGMPLGGTYSGTGISNSTHFSPETAGIGSHNISYQYTDANSCTNSASALIVVDACAKLDEQVNEPFISIFPNPCNGQFKLVTEQVVSTILVYDNMGKICKTLSSDTEGLYSLEGLSNGSYTLLISGKNSQEFVKFTLLK